MQIHIFTKGDDPQPISQAYHHHAELLYHLQSFALYAASAATDTGALLERAKNAKIKSQFITIIQELGYTIQIEPDQPLYVWSFAHHGALAHEAYHATTTKPTIQAALKVINAWARLSDSDADEYALDSDCYSGRVTVDRNLIFNPLTHNIALLHDGESDCSLIFHGPAMPNEVI